MNDYIREMAASLVDCAVIAFPEDIKIDVDPIDGITFIKHPLPVVEYRDSAEVVLMRHTVIEI